MSKPKYERGSAGSLSAKGIATMLNEIKEIIPQYVPSYWDLVKEDIKKHVKELNDIVNSRP